eukprot:3015741-Rhodomonas_salina.1
MDGGASWALWEGGLFRVHSPIILSHVKPKSVVVGGGTPVFVFGSGLFQTSVRDPIPESEGSRLSVERLRVSSGGSGVDGVRSEVGGGTLLFVFGAGLFQTSVRCPIFAKGER